MILDASAAYAVAKGVAGLAGSSVGYDGYYAYAV